MTKSVTLITGASAGLGVDFARQLAARGERLVLVARREDRLAALAAELGNSRAVAVDLGEAGAAGRLMADLAAHGEQVACLVNNAGFGLAGRFAELDGVRQFGQRAAIEIDHLPLARAVELGETPRQPEPGIVHEARDLLAVRGKVGHEPSRRARLAEVDRYGTGIAQLGSKRCKPILAPCDQHQLLPACGQLAGEVDAEAS